MKKLTSYEDFKMLSFNDQLNIDIDLYSLSELNQIMNWIHQADKELYYARHQMLLQEDHDIFVDEFTEDELNIPIQTLIDMAKNKSML